MAHDVHEGGCQCGAVRYETKGEPIRAMACHCTTCKLRTGAPYGVGVYFDDANVSFNDGETATYEFRSDTSGRWMRNHFCVKCGTCVSWTLEMRPGVRGIGGGTFDDPQWYDIASHIWTRSARKDMCYPEGIPTYEGAMT